MQGKHLELNRSRPNPKTRIWSSCFGDSPFGRMPFAGGPVWVIYVDGRELDVRKLADRVLVLWEQFFADHGL